MIQELKAVISNLLNMFIQIEPSHNSLKLKNGRSKGHTNIYKKKLGI